MLPEKVQKSLTAFFAQHPDELFYSLKIDAGFIGLNSEQGFEQNRLRAAARWDADVAPVTLAEVKACTGHDLEDRFRRIHSAMNGHPPMSLEAALAKENARREQKRAAGNPYHSRDSEEWQHLRWQGSSTHGELVSLGLSRQYEAHYNMSDAKQKTSAYATKVKEILAELEASKATLFAGARLTDDFRIYSIEHGY